METRSLLALLMVPLAFAGCTDEGNDTDSADGVIDTDTNATIEPKLFELAGEITTGAGAAGLYLNPTAAVDTQRFLEFSVPTNATGTVVELVWSDNMNDLDILIDDPDGNAVVTVTAGSYGAGDGPIRAVFTADELPAGSYTAGIWAKNAANESFELKITVFETEIPEDYTAFA